MLHTISVAQLQKPSVALYCLLTRLWPPYPLCCGYWSSLGHDWDFRLGSLLFRHGGGGEDLLFGLHDADMVRQRLLGANLAAGIPGKHDLNLDTEHTWTQTKKTQNNLNQGKVILQQLLLQDGFPCQGDFFCYCSSD